MCKKYKHIEKLICHFAYIIKEMNMSNTHQNNYAHYADAFLES